MLYVNVSIAGMEHIHLRKMHERGNPPFFSDFQNFLLVSSNTENDFEITVVIQYWHLIAGRRPKQKVIVLFLRHSVIFTKKIF